MDEFQALLAGRKTAEPAAPVDEFEALLARKPKAAKPDLPPGGFSTPGPDTRTSSRVRFPDPLTTALSAPSPRKTAPGTIPGPIPGEEQSGSRFLEPAPKDEFERTARNRETAARVADSLWTGVKNFSPRQAVSATADILDMSLGSVAAGLLGTAGEVTQRVAAVMHGRDIRQGEKLGAEFSQYIGEQYGRPFRDSLVAAGLLKKDDHSLPQQVMEEISGMLVNAATIVEADSGGLISKENYLFAVNAFMAGLGVKGVQVATQAAINRVGTKRQTNAWNSALERYDAEEQLARQVEVERDAAKLTTPVANAAKIRLMARTPKEATRTPKQAREDARAAFLTPEAGEQAGLIDRQAGYREELAAQEAAIRDRFPPSGERTGSRGPVELNLEGKETPTTYSGNQPFHTADTTTAIKRGVVADTPIEMEGTLRPAARPALDTALEKVKGGRLFDMTAEERIAIRNSVDITDPKVITAAAVGATGLGLAMAYEPSAEEAAMAIGAGALLRRGGEGMPMRELLAKPEATPLGALLESSAYTTSTLEKLADQSPGKFEFKKTAIEQLLKREGVTKHERDLMTAALAQAPGDTITAKQLMVGLRVAAQDFELTPEKVGNFADYGLDRIDRKLDEGLGEESIPPLEELSIRNGHVVDRYGDVIDEIASGQTLEAWREAITSKAVPEETITRIYRSPLELGSNNHFGDPNYFAHTRSFVEDGVRHVVELQSDLAQKAGKAPDPETLAKAKQQLEVNEAIDAAWSDVQYGVSRAGNYSFFDGLQRFFKREPELSRTLGHDDQRGMLEERLWRTASWTTDPALQKVAEEFHANWEKTATPQLREGYAQGWVDISDGFAEWLIKNKDRLASDRSETTLRYALQDLANRKTQEALVGISEAKSKLTAGASAQVAPMLKDWHKRLVREELADAARQLEPSVRFATADTVAKVEGWPKPRAALQERLRAVDEDLARLNSPWGIKHWKEGRQAEIDRVSSHRQEILTRLEDEPTDFRPEHQGIYDRYSRDVEKFLRQLGAKPITDSAGHTWLEVPLGEQQKTLPGGGARTQIGGVDPQLAKAVAAVGGTAALAWFLSRDKDKAKHPAMAGVLTGLGLLVHSRVPAIRAEVAKTIQGTQNLIGNISTDKAISPPLLRRLTSHAEEEMRGIHDSGKRIAPFLEIADQLPASVKKDLDAALLNGRTSDVVAAVGKAATPGLLKAWNEVQVELKSLGSQLVAVRGLKELRPDYFPRIVKDLPGLMTAIGKEFSTPLQQALKVAEARAGGFLDEAGRSQVINTFIEKNLRASVAGGKPSFFKRRTLGDVTVDLAPYYVEPSQALPLYIGSAVRAIEKAKFFGKELVRDDGGRPNLEASIGNIVAREIEAGNITPENFTRLTDLLRTRFGPAYQSPARGLQSLSQLTNIALLGNVFSGLMNVADIGAIAAQHNVLPLIAAVTKMVRGTAKLKAADVGMTEAIGAEFVYGTRDPVKMRIPLTERTVQISLAKALDKTFKLSGFKALDTVMKEVNLNAAMEKYSRLSRTKAGEARIQKQYGAYFTSDMPALLADLRAGAKTKLTTELAFRELSDAQPTTKIEMPKFYLDHPNLRFGYALKSFMIKQMNFVKKRGIDEIRKGNVVEGGGFIVRYVLMAGAAGATMDWVVKSLLGRDADLDWKSIPLNALKNMGLSEYVIDKARQGKGKEAILAATVPPADPILNIVTADPQSVRYFPLVGRLAYDRFMDGAEKANAAKKLAEKKKRRDAERTPEERRDLEQRALERRKELVHER